MSFMTSLLSNRLPSRPSTGSGCLWLHGVFNSLPPQGDNKARNMPESSKEFEVSQRCRGSAKSHRALSYSDNLTREQGVAV